ncbi:MAG: NADPH:quinone oxidoreductase family protein [Gammaproteobacteria bacterium]|nr:NADPH:quinone oxidoreductase family protein [Gammaproteobacteria bacterium]
MRAVVVEEVGNRESIRLAEVAAPKPGRGEILLDVDSIGINFPDLLVIDGKYQTIPPTPFTPGKEAAGVITEVGEDVTRVKPGDRVMVQVNHGAFAEQVVAREAHTYSLPTEMDFKIAAAMGLVYQTSYFALTDRAGVKPGDTVLVTGASGGIGVAGIQLAKALGATVFAGLTTMSKAQAILDAGADHIIDLTKDDLKDTVRQQVHELTNGKGVDVVLDGVGGDVFDACLRALAWGGRIVIVGFTSGRIPTIKTNYLLLKNVSAVGMTINSYFNKAPEMVQQAQEEIFKLFKGGKINPLVMGEYSLDRFSDALDVLESRKIIGKVILSTKD